MLYKLRIVPFNKAVKAVKEAHTAETQIRMKYEAQYSDI